MTLPASSLISAVRRSHSTCWNGLVLGSLKTRLILSDFFGAEPLPLAARVAVTGAGRRVLEAATDKTSSLVSIMANPFVHLLLLRLTDLNATTRRIGFNLPRFLKT